MRSNHLSIVMPAQRHPAASRGGDPVVAGIHVFLAAVQRERRGWPGQAHECPARFVLEDVHGIDSIRFQVVANHLDTKKDQHRAAPEYRFSWPSEAYSVGGL